VAHTQLVHPDDLPRFAELGVVANFEPLWAQQNRIMTELTEPRLGAERSARQYPMASVLRSGATVGFGSDWPVSSMVPMEGLAVAVHRRTRAGAPSGGWLPAERLSLDEALAAYTSGSAAVDPHGSGTITVGAPADLVVLEADVTALAPDELADVAVEGTWRAGEVTFRR
ncbi:MAG: amidohydrolase family protein, partial [Acidimicrobiia bacterium]|nr:amidohydrolase family protein [Acidimicrobiia bacterium]